MKFIIEWCEKHAKEEEEAADVSDLPNLGITTLDDVTDCPVISRLTRNEMKAVLKDCTRLNLQVKCNNFSIFHFISYTFFNISYTFFHFISYTLFQQPLIIILLKTMFKRYNLEKIVIKDVRNLTKKITVFNPTKSKAGSETNSLADQCGDLNLGQGEQ